MTSVAAHPTGTGHETHAVKTTVYRAAGAAHAKPEYKAGLCWEPGDALVVAATYSQELDGTRRAGCELRVLVDGRYAQTGTSEPETV